MFFPFLFAWLATIVTFLLAALCIAWSPFAALTCARIARRNGLNARRYAMLGAMYSVLLFLPWLYLTLRMRGKPVFRDSIKSAYSVVYVVAALLLACHIFFLITEIGIYPHSDEFLNLLGSLIFAVLTAAGALALGAGIVSALRMNRRFAERDGRQESRVSIDLPDRSCIAPFAWAWASMLICSGWWFLWPVTYNVFIR